MRTSLGRGRHIVIERRMAGRDRRVRVEHRNLAAHREFVNRFLWRVVAEVCYELLQIAFVIGVLYYRGLEQTDRRRAGGFGN
jgi:hypothetical protein